MSAECLLSDHEYDLEPQVCGGPVCPTSSVTLHRAFDGTGDTVVVTVGVVAGDALDDAVRHDLDLVAVVTPMEDEDLSLVKQALIQLLDRLDEDDRFALIGMGNWPEVVLDSRAMDDAGRERAAKAVHRLKNGAETPSERSIGRALERGAAQLTSTERASHQLVFAGERFPLTAISLLLPAEATLYGVRTREAWAGVRVDYEIRESGGDFAFLDEGTLDSLFGEGLDARIVPIAYEARSSMEDVPVISILDLSSDFDETIEMRRSAVYAEHPDPGFVVLSSGALGEELGTVGVTYEQAGEWALIDQTMPIGWQGGTFAGDADSAWAYEVDAVLHEHDALRMADEWCRGGPDPTEEVKAASDLLDEMADVLDDEEVDEVARRVGRLSSLVGDPDACP